MRFPLNLFLALSLVLPSSLLAAISVSGISNKTSYSGARSFTVADPAGFTTVATLNGASVTVGSAVNVSGAGHYELVVTETPDGGGAAVSQTFLFNLREPERGSSETGLPAFVAAPLVNDAPSAVNTGSLIITMPSAYPDELALPVVARLQKNNGDPLWLHSPVVASNFPQSPIQLRRGFGYTILPAQSGSVTYDAKTAGLTQNASSVIETGTTWTTVSGSISSNTTWAANSRVHVTGNLTIDAGVMLTVGAGTIVKVATNGDIFVDGSLVVNGTAADPVVFAPASAPARWGGFFLEQSTSDVVMTGAICFGACADQDWFDTHSGFASHRPEQAVFLVGPAGASLSLSECFLIGNDGQLLHNDSGGDISLSHCLLQGATTCGELTGGTLTIDRSALLAFPDATTDFEDGDNDAIYLTSGTHLLTNTVIGYTKDDGIDTGGSPSASTNTTTTVQFCWFESILHEGMSNSGAKTCRAEDTVFFNCGQTIECGYDGPQSFLERSLCVANLTGARFGDNYNWDYSGNHLTVKDSLLLYNLYHDIWGYDWSSWTYNSANMDVSGTYMTESASLARHPGNTAYDPMVNGSLIAPFMPVPGSNVGVAITGIAGQSPIDSYAPDFQVQLSTPSSNPVSVAYSLSGKVNPTDSESTVIGAGTAVFNQGETLKRITLPLSANHGYGLVRVALSAPANAEITGGEAWYFANVAGPSGTIVIPRSTAGWLYDAQRAEPAAGWKGLPYDDSGWKPATTEVGFGEGDEATTLTAAEQGPTGDKTTTVYFRRTFQLSDASAVTEMQIELNRDDGAVVYINGMEVGRENIDPGPVTYATLADNASPENVFNTMPVPAAVLATLQDGDNVIAVEVHQSSLTSSDLGFDLELSAVLAGDESGESGFTRFDGGTYLFWIDPTLQPEESDDLGVWVPMNSTRSPYPVPFNAPRKFYRFSRD
jgi:hypothetical protein